MKLIRLTSLHQNIEPSPKLESNIRLFFGPMHFTDRFKEGKIYILKDGQRKCQLDAIHLDKLK